MFNEQDVYDVLRGMINDYIGRDDAEAFMKDFEKRMLQRLEREQYNAEIAALLPEHWITDEGKPAFYRR